MTCQTYTIHWNDIEIEARYTPEDFGGVIAHLELESIHPSRAPLPMTDTGFRSHYHPVGTIEAKYDGDVVKAVTDWLNKEAKSKKWQEYVERSKQLELF